MGKAITCEEALANALINEKLIIDPLSRKIYIPENEEFFGVYTDRNSERKYFRCPRIVGNNVDLSTCYIFVNYISAKGEPGQYWCKDVAVDDTGDYVDFSWELTGNVFDKNADCEIYFAVNAKKINESEPVFNTLKAKGRIGETVVAGDYIEEAHADVILQILARLDEMPASGATAEQLLQIEQNKKDIGQLQEQIADLSKGEINISNYGLTAKDKGNGIVEILLTAIATSGVTQSGNVLTIIDGITVTQNGSTLAIA